MGKKINTAQELFKGLMRQDILNAWYYLVHGWYNKIFSASDHLLLKVLTSCEINVLKQAQREET